MGAAGYHWRVGGRLKYFALASVVVGVAMQFIWIDAATPVHPDFRRCVPDMAAGDGRDAGTGPHRGAAAPAGPADYAATVMTQAKD